MIRFRPMRASFRRCSGVLAGKSQIFVHVVSHNLVPGQIRQGGQPVEGSHLRGSGRKDDGDSFIPRGQSAQAFRGLLRRGLSHRLGAFVHLHVKAFDAKRTDDSTLIGQHSSFLPPYCCSA